MQHGHGTHQPDKPEADKNAGEEHDASIHLSHASQELMMQHHHGHAKQMSEADLQIAGLEKKLRSDPTGHRAVLDAEEKRVLNKLEDDILKGNVKDIQKVLKQFKDDPTVLDRIRIALNTEMDGRYGSAASLEYHKGQPEIRISAGEYDETVHYCVSADDYMRRSFGGAICDFITESKIKSGIKHPLQELRKELRDKYSVK